MCELALVTFAKVNNCVTFAYTKTNLVELGQMISSAIGIGSQPYLGH